VALDDKFIETEQWHHCVVSTVAFLNIQPSEAQVGDLNVRDLARKLLRHCEEELTVNPNLVACPKSARLPRESQIECMP